MSLKYLRVLLIILVLVFMTLSLFIGAMDLTLAGILGGNPKMVFTLIYSRLPRMLSIVLVASSLSISGVILQKIARNPFVSAQTMVTSDAIRLGVLVSLIFGLGSNERLIIGAILGFFATVTFLKLTQKISGYGLLVVPLFGVIVGKIIESITSLIALKFDLTQVLNGIFNSGFTSIFQGEYEILYFNILMISISLLYWKRFVIVGLGESLAQNLGVDENRVTRLGILLVSIMSGTTALTVGNIPYVGLLIPNIVARFEEVQNPFFLFDAALISSCFLLVCDIAARLVIFPYEIPLTLITSMVGSVIFICILVRGKYNEKT